MLPRILILAALGLLMCGVITETRRLTRLEADGAAILPFFLATIALALVMGVIVALWLAPMIGNRVGGFFYNPSEEVEKNPHSAAMALVAQGDYEGAIEAYKAVLDKNPADLHAVSEIVHLYCDRLHEPGPAAGFLEQTLQLEQPVEKAAFLASRLADVCWTHQRDGLRAKAILLKVAEMLPETTHAANAMHRIREIEHALALQEQERTS